MPDVWTSAYDYFAGWGTPVFVDGEMVAVVMLDEFLSCVEDAIIAESSNPQQLEREG